MRVELGNLHPRGLDRPSVTLAILPGNDSADEQFGNITNADGIWGRHSKDPAPAWVEASNPEFAARLADHYSCPIGRPADWEATA